MAVLAVGKVLRERLTDEGVSEFITIINDVEEAVKKDSLVLVEERFERRLKEEISWLDNRITGEIAKLKTEDIAKLDNRITGDFAKLDRRITEEITKLDNRITGEIAKLKTEDIAKLDRRITEDFAKLDRRITEEIAKVRTDIAQFKTEIIKWMFLFWIGQLVVIAGLLKLIR